MFCNPFRNAAIPKGAISLSLLTAIAWCGDVSAQVKATSIFPSGGQRGKSVAVTIGGTFPTWPPQVQIIGEGVKVAFDKKKGKAKLEVDPNAEVGVRFLRFYDAKGAAVWRPFAVSGVADSEEQEPNDAHAKPQSVVLPQIVNGRLAKAGDVDTFAVKLKAGQTLVAAVDAKRLVGSAMDCVLQICDSRGFVLAQNDDGRGIDPLIAFPIKRDGEYLVRLFCFPEKPNSSIRFAGSSEYIYRLSLTVGGFVDFALPLAVQRGTSATIALRGWNLPAAASAAANATEPTTFIQRGLADGVGHVLLPVIDAACIVADKDAGEASPQTVALPACVSGSIESPRDEDTFAVAMKKGERLRVAVESFALGFPLDPMVSVTSADGKLLKEADDQSRAVRDVSTTVTAPADGVLRVQIRDVHGFGGSRFAYRMMIEKDDPGFRLTVSSESVAVTVGKEAELTVNLQRLGGFKDPLVLTIQGLPEGIKADPLKLDAKAKSGKFKLTAAADAKPYSGSITIEGTSGERKATATYRVREALLDSIWLTVAK